MKFLMDLARHKWALPVALALLALVAIGVWLQVRAQGPVPEVALKLGEPWEDMRKRSSAEIDPTITDTSAFGIIASDARMRFIDPKYGFVTPRARFFTIAYSQQKIEDVRMSPQVESLLIDDALKIVIDLQDQWRKGG